MKCLFLDLASQSTTIACVGDAVAALQSTDDRLTDDLLIPMVESVLEEAGWKYSDITHLACVLGPGGFTSLRVAVTFVNVLADQLGIPSAGIHLSDLYDARTDESDVYWVHSTKKDQLFVRGGKWNEPTLIALNDIPCGPWMGELIDEHKKAAGSESVLLKPLEEVLPEFVSELTYSEEILRPWYGRGW